MTQLEIVQGFFVSFDALTGWSYMTCKWCHEKKTIPITSIETYIRDHRINCNR